jgi:hypothetical protein
MQVFFEQGRLIFEAGSEGEKAELAEWWAQLQATGTMPRITSATAEKALVLFIPQR